MEFQESQFQFAAHIRNPELNPAPLNIEDRRLQIYRELFYNNIENFIATGFPVIREITDDLTWHAMVRDFFTRHKCQSPYFLEISAEFLEYLQNERASETDYPFLLELAHYEWMELAVDISEEEIPGKGFNSDGDLMLGTPVISPLAYVVSYHFPVHQIGPDFMPMEPPAQPSFLIVYRDLEDDVRFMEINAVTARLFEILKENPFIKGVDAVHQIAKEMQHPDISVVEQGGRQAFSSLHAAGIILGTALTVVS